MEQTECWWINCHFSDLAGREWTGMLLDQGPDKDNGGFVVITRRDEANRELESQGQFLWVVPDGQEEGFREDRLVPSHRLEYAELIAVG